tara:strand:+ start:582 stop:737 length:156 start_codon:yes stop_codon:yes gene_type:complete
MINLVKSQPTEIGSIFLFPIRVLTLWFSVSVGFIVLKFTVLKFTGGFSFKN